MPSLANNSRTTWKKKAGTTLSVAWADTGNPGKGTVSVIVGNGAATSYTVPQGGININDQAGSLTNNTDKTINYTLS